MEDIRVDEDGNLRCAGCGGKNFHGRRTARAHVIGYTTVGIGALATQKKLRCQECGAYNKQGNAKPWREPGEAKVGSGRGSPSGGGGSNLPAGVRYIRVDDDGDFRCWHCGFTEFHNPPNMADMTDWEKIKAPSSVYAAQAKRDKCKRCGNRNEMSHPRAWEGPASNRSASSRPEPPPAEPEITVADELGKLADLRDRGILSDEEFQEQKSKLLDG